MAPNVEAELRRLLSGQERVPMRRLLDDLKRFCQGAGQRAPSRASVYLLMDS